MKTLSISEIRKHLPEVIDSVLASNEGVVITRHGQPVACVQPFQEKESGKDRYPLRETPIRIAKDFDDPIPDLWNALAVAEEKATYTSSKRKRRS